MLGKHKIGIARICVSGSHRNEATNFVVEAERTSWKDSRIEHIAHIPIARTPTPVARNVVTNMAKKLGLSIIFQLDDDMWFPNEFYQAAVDFLLAHNGPAVIASPYCQGPPEEKVNVFEYGTPGNGVNVPFVLLNVTREDAARRKGIEKVAAIGTGCIAYRVDAFDKITHPYFDYKYTDDSHTAVSETEDCWNCRKLHYAKVPIYCHWDWWSSHYKTLRVEKPGVVSDAQIEGIFTREAAADVRNGGRELAKLIPDGFTETPPDFGPVYAQAVHEVPAGGHLVEVGSWLGQSAILMARLIECGGRPLKFTCVDHFLGTPDERRSVVAGTQDNYYAHVVAEHGGCVREAFDANLERCGVKDRVNVLQLPSVDAAKAFPDGSLDFVFLDAAHDYESVKADIRAWAPKLKDGAILAGHDFGWSGVARAVAEMIGDVKIIGTSWVWKVIRTVAPLQLEQQMNRLHDYAVSGVTGRGYEHAFAGNGKETNGDAVH